MESFDLGDFRLQCGATLPAAKLAYKVHGTLNAAKDNAILFPSFLGGAPEALEYLKRFDFEPPAASFDAAFSQG